MPGVAALSRRIEDSFHRRLAPLAPAPRQLLLVAAAEPQGDSALLWRAAARLGIGVHAAKAAESEGLVELGAQVFNRLGINSRTQLHLALPGNGDRA
jgi:hypothetical protein